MNKINSKQTGKRLLSPLQSFVTALLGSVWVISIATAHFIGLPNYAVIAVLAIVGIVITAIFLGVIIDATRFDRIATYCSFRIRKWRGKEQIHTFVLPLKELKKHIPIEQIHKDGIVEYSGRVYGMMFRYDPPNVKGDQLSGFHKNMEYVANSLPQGVVASFHFYNMVDHSNPLADITLKAINTEGKTLEQRKHLHAQYSYAMESDEATVAPAYLLSVRLGKFKSIDHAKIAYKSTIPGLTKSLRERGIYTMQLVRENEIAATLREFATMERYQ